MVWFVWSGLPITNLRAALRLILFTLTALFMLWLVSGCTTYRLMKGETVETDTRIPCAAEVITYQGDYDMDVSLPAWLL